MRRKRRQSTPQQRVVAAKSTDDKDVDFDYDETTEVLEATIAELTSDAESARQRVNGVAETLRSITLPPRSAQQEAKTG